MRKRVGLAFLLGFFIGYPFELSALTINEEEKKPTQEYLQKNKQKKAIALASPTVHEKYNTPSIYENSGRSEARTTGAHAASSDRASKVSEITPFGSYILSGSATTFAPVPETPRLQSCLFGPGDQVIISPRGRADLEYNFSFGHE